MKLRPGFYCAIFSLGLIFSISSARANELEATSLSDWDSVRDTLKKTQLSYFSIFTGPGITQGGVRTIERDGSTSETAINNWTQLTVSLPMSSRVNLEINPAFSSYYDNREKPMVMEDSTIGVGIRYYSSERLSINGGLNTILFPTTQDSIDDGLRYNPGGFQSLRYKVTEDFALGSWLWFRFQNFDDNTGKRNFRSFAGPYANYTLSDRFSVMTWLDFFFDHMPDRNLTAIERRDYVDYTLGANYSYASWLDIFPYLRTEITKGLDTEKVAIGAWISGRLF